MSNSKVLDQTVLSESDSRKQRANPKTTAWNDFLALVKIGIIKSNLITVFTGLWLALHFSGMSFLKNLQKTLKIRLKT